LVVIYHKLSHLTKSKNYIKGDDAGNFKILSVLNDLQLLLNMY